MDDYEIILEKLRKSKKELQEKNNLLTQVNIKFHKHKLLNQMHYIALLFGLLPADAYIFFLMFRIDAGGLYMVGFVLSVMVLSIIISIFYN